MAEGLALVALVFFAVACGHAQHPGPACGPGGSTPPCYRFTDGINWPKDGPRPEFSSAYPPPCFGGGATSAESAAGGVKSRSLFGRIKQRMETRRTARAGGIFQKRLFKRDN